MTEKEFEKSMNNNELDSEYSEFIMNMTNARICNGDDLILAIESGDYYEYFQDFMTLGELA
jgi:hypothetical protein